jgi:hypothetical protein
VKRNQNQKNGRGMMLRGGGGGGGERRQCDWGLRRAGRNDFDRDEDISRLR